MVSSSMSNSKNWKTSELQTDLISNVNDKLVILIHDHGLKSKEERSPDHIKMIIGKKFGNKVKLIKVNSFSQFL